MVIHSLLIFQRLFFFFFIICLCIIQFIKIHLFKNSIFNIFPPNLFMGIIVWDKLMKAFQWTEFIRNQEIDQEQEVSETKCFSLVLFELLNDSDN